MSGHEINLKHGLQKWAETHGIKPSQFSKTMGYSYMHAYGMLRGERGVTYETIGRFVQMYGTQATSELLTLAGLPVVKTELSPAKTDGQPVLVITPAVPVYVTDDPATQAA